MFTLLDKLNFMFLLQDKNRQIHKMFHFLTEFLMQINIYLHKYNNISLLL